MRLRDVPFWAILLCVGCAARVLPSNDKRDLTTNLPSTPAYVANLGLTSDSAFNPNIRRDGGGGGYVNGRHIIGFSDTITVNNGQHGALTDFDSFVHNTFAYMGYVRHPRTTRVAPANGHRNNKPVQQIYMTLAPGRQAAPALSQVQSSSRLPVMRQTLAVDSPSGQPVRLHHYVEACPIVAYEPLRQLRSFRRRQTSHRSHELHPSRSQHSSKPRERSLLQHTSRHRRSRPIASPRRKHSVVATSHATALLRKYPIFRPIGIDLVN